MINFIKYIIEYFKTQRHNIVAHQVEFGNPPPDFDNPPSEFMPIESYYDMHRIPGTTLDVGAVAKVLQAPSNEVVTLNQRKGVRTGCGHHIYTVDKITTEIWVQQGIGGVCHYCAQEAAQLLNQGVISIKQAEELSLYCSQCASQCDGCRRSNLCLRHSQRFEDWDGSVSFLCPDCLIKAENEKFFKKTLAVMLSPFIDHRRLPPPRQRRNHYDY